MRYTGKGISAFIVVALMLVVSQQASAVVTVWGVDHGTLNTIPNPSSGQDIVSATLTTNDTSHIFSINLFGSPTAPSNFASEYTILIGTGAGLGTFDTYETLTGFPADVYVNATYNSVTFKRNGQTIYSLNLIGSGSGVIEDGGVGNLSGFTFSKVGNVLTWVIPKSELSLSFAWMGATFSGYNFDTKTLIDRTAATPIPNAAWLLGAGVIALVGIKRRRTRVG